MWHGLANSDMRPATGAPHKGAHDLQLTEFPQRDAFTGRPLRNRSQAINNPRPVALCVGAVPEAFLARQVPTNGRRKTVAKTDSSGWRPAANSWPSPKLVNVAWFHDLRPAVCEQRAPLAPSCVGAVPKGGPPRPIGHILNGSMWHDFATCEQRPAAGAPSKGRPRPTNLSGLLGHLPYEGRHNDERHRRRR